MKPAMKSPFTGKDMIVVKEQRTMTYRKEPFDVIFHAYQCEDTGEQFEDEHFAQLNYQQVVHQYRVRHRIPFPEQIKAIREKYGLSAAKMSEIMGMGANSWGLYEKGEVPSKAHASLIQLIRDPDNFELQVSKFAELKEAEKAKILKRISKLKNEGIDFNDQLLRFKNEPDLVTGFKEFNREKTKQVIQFFAEYLKPYKTKLNKLLFYSDFAFFRAYGESITGLKYQAIQFGPVPVNYDILFGALANTDVIDVEYAMTSKGEVERILPSPVNPFNKSLLTEQELEVLEYVAQKFRKTGAAEIAEISHKEPAWIDNIEEKSIIPFFYAFDLRMV